MAVDGTFGLGVAAFAAERDGFAVEVGLGVAVLVGKGDGFIVTEENTSFVRFSK